MMSSILEKTFKHTLSIMKVPGNESVAPDLLSLQNAVMGQSRSTDRREVRKKIVESSALLKEKCHDLKLTNSEKRLCMQIIIHLGNLNVTLPSVYPFIIKFIDDGCTLHDKLLGHIALRVVNRERSPDIYIAVNTLQKDICSKNHVVALTALNTLASIIDLDMVPVFHPHVDNLFRKSSNPTIRCKALHVLEVMHSIGPEYLPNIWKVVLHALCDRDPHVMSASLPLLQNLLRNQTPPENSKICEKLIFILKQILDGRLPLDMMYSGICAPWDQIRILKILNSLPATYFSEQCFIDMAQIIEQLLALLQISAVVQVAIALECIHIISHFHSNLEKLEKSAIDIINIALDSENPNITYSALEMIKCVKQFKPGVSKLFKERLLQILTDSNPSSFNVIVEIFDDLASPEESKELVTDLLKKLETINYVQFKKKVVLSVLRIFEHSLLEEDPDWLIENYKNLLQTLGTDFDFELIQKLVNCVKLASLETRKKEFTVIITTLDKNDVSPLQYCVMLEILLSCHEEVEKELCGNVITTILHVLSCHRSLCHLENILLYSWKTIMEIAGYHKIAVDSNEFTLISGQNLPMMMQILFLETTHLLSEQDLLEMFIQHHENILGTDGTSSTTPKLPRDEVSTFNSTIRSTVSSQSTIKSIFKTQQYSQSRFSNVDTIAVTPEKPKKTFLSKQMMNTASTSPVAWDSSKYKSSSSSIAKTENT